jgi:hypothetical protein
VNNQGSTGNGIVFNTGGMLHIESCVVSGFSSGDGVFFNGQSKLEVKDSIMRGNGNGIQVGSPLGTALAAIDQVRAEGCGIGVIAREGSQVTVRNSVASGNQAGFEVLSVNSGSAELDIENCVASNNSIFGIYAQSVSTGVTTVRLSNSTVTGNGTGLFNNGSPAVILSRGNNTVEANGSNTGGAIGSYLAK